MYEGISVKYLFSFRTIYTAFTVGAVVYALRSGQPTGRFLNVPYDFRFPTVDRIRDLMWNEDDERVFMPSVFGVGWTLNLFKVIEKFRADNAVEEELIEDDPSPLSPSQPLP